MTVVVFCGPTISAEAVRSRIDAECRPPAAQGDVLRCLAARPRAVAIIDGYFDHQPAVWHKEILVALSQGVHVFGAASMGALRAAELHEYGMVGVGAVFEAFRADRLVDDDEVAVIHGPVEEGCPPLSTAMVDLRDRIQRAAAAGHVSDADAAALIAIAKELPYAQRSLPAVIAGARDRGLGEDVLHAVTRFATGDGPGLKERDARSLVDVVADFVAGDPAPMSVEWELEWTVFLDALVDDVQRGRHSEEEGLDRTGLVASQALLHLLAESEGRRLGLAVSDAEVDEAVSSLRRTHGLGDAETMVRWMEDTGVDWPELVEWACRQLMTDRVAHAYRFELGARARTHQRIETALRAASR